MNPAGMRFRKVHSIISRPVGEEIVIVPTEGKGSELKKIYAISGSGVRMWELIDGRNSLEAIRDILLAEYDVAPQRLEKDLAALVESLLRKNFIEPVIAGRKGGR